MVWIGAVCGVMTDALPGTYHGDESPCDHCDEGCVQVAASVSEYEVDDPDAEELEEAA